MGHKISIAVVAVVVATTVVFSFTAAVYAQDQTSLQGTVPTQGRTLLQEAVHTQDRTTLQGLVRDAHQMFAPVANMRHLEVRCDLPGSNLLSSSEVEKARERVINLLANAVAMASENSRIQVRLAPESQELIVFIGNEKTERTLERNVQDQCGNSFRMRSLSGRGTELLIRFPAPVR